MLVWVGVLFGLGVAAFIDSLYNFGDIFRQINSVIFLLISVGLLVRTTTLKKRGRLENYRGRVEKLERDIKTLANQRQPLDF
ncbi:MAG TPA: hypothetical protein VLB27_05100 [candidate division Zixibacteria bacterium]|nr:hypothetical protein [candidate division Zixibacteria bacterium]